MCKTEHTNVNRDGGFKRTFITQYMRGINCGHLVKHTSEFICIIKNNAKSFVYKQLRLGFPFNDIK